MIDEDDFGPITEEVLERRRALASKMVALTGITYSELYLPGIVTLNDAAGMVPDMPERRLILVAWKIDDTAWQLRTRGVAFISDNDPEARAGRYSFTEDSHSWAQGVEPFIDMDEAIALRDRILRLTAEFGLEIDSFEASIIPA